MTEDQFLERWNRERPMYEAWGQHVAQCITEQIRSLVAPVSTDIFIRIPVKARVKTDGSFITKAFYRKEKNYKDPFEEITDSLRACAVPFLNALPRGMVVARWWREREPQRSIVLSDASVGDAG